MKKYLLFLCLLVAVLWTNAQSGLLDGLQKKINNDSNENILSQVAGNIRGGNSLSNEEIIRGLKEALAIGTDSSAKKLSRVDGFFADAAIKILMPPEAAKAEKTLRNMGMSSLVDKAILSMNRAAEDAASGVVNIFLDAIKQMTLTDGIGILRGGDFAATNYLKKTTSQVLADRMRPVIQVSLDKVNATQYWKDVFTTYNKFSRQQVDTDLSSYVTGRAMEGVFYSIGQEEQKIRKDPKAQVTDLLKKVFAK